MVSPETLVKINQKKYPKPAKGPLAKEAIHVEFLDGKGQVMTVAVLVPSILP